MDSFDIFHISSAAHMVNGAVVSGELGIEMPVTPFTSAFAIANHIHSDYRAATGKKMLLAENFSLHHICRREQL